MRLEARVDPPVTADSPEARQRAELLAAWHVPRGVLGWIGDVNHKSIALRYIVTAFAFFVLGGLAAMLMRLQLARPEAGIVSPDLYNQLFSVHGSTMMFLFAVPVMQALGLYVVPLAIGTRTVAFPRLNAFGYFVYLFGGLFLWVSFLLGIGPDRGWFSYVPLAGPGYAAGKRVDVWAQMITFTEIASLVAAVVTIVTILKMRAPGMSLARIPIYVWAILVMSVMVIFAMPAIMVASTLLAMDRLVDTHFFNPAEGGDALLWQHLFWFFGHPEVYIIFVPGTGIVSALIVTFSRRRVFGHPAIVFSLIATAAIGFGLWVHHMFATNAPELGESFFTVSSMLITVPSGLQIFCWLATLATGRPVLRVPLLYALGFVVIFVAGGLTGVMLASVPLDAQVHDSFFVVAHFHYVLIGGAVFPLLGGIYYWFPKMTGKMLGERLGRWSFWLLFMGFNVTFFPMHQLGLQGMPRRMYTYLPDVGWTTLNQLASAGVAVMAVALVLGVINVAWSLRAGAPAGPNPWGADTLEWATTSPPPVYNFAYLPTVRDNYALWSQAPDQPVVTGMRTDIPEVLITTLLDAVPDHRHGLDGPSLWPFVTAVSAAITFIGVIFTPWAVPIGAALLLPPLIGWFWPLRAGRTIMEPR